MLCALRGFHSSSESGPLKMLNVTGISAGLSGKSVLVISVNTLEYQQELFLYGVLKWESCKLFWKSFIL